MKKLILTLLIVSSISLTACSSSSTSASNVIIPTKQTTSQILSQPNTTKATNISTKIDNTKTNINSSNIQYYFTRANQHPDVQLINIINSSKTNLDIAIYSLTKKSIVDAIIQAKNRNVTVRIISDKQESKSKSEKKMLTLLQNANIPIKINTHSGLMHMKITIIDKNIITTGSYNYSEGASTKNDEVLMIIKDSKIAQDFETEFNNMWNDNTNYKDYN